MINIDKEDKSHSRNPNMNFPWSSIFTFWSMCRISTAPFRTWSASVRNGYVHRLSRPNSSQSSSSPHTRLARAVQRVEEPATSASEVIQNMQPYSIQIYEAYDRSEVHV